MSVLSSVQPDLRRRKRINWQKVLVIFLFAVVPLFLLIPPLFRGLAALCRAVVRGVKSIFIKKGR